MSPSMQRKQTVSMRKLKITVSGKIYRETLFVPHPPTNLYASRRRPGSDLGGVTGCVA